jgi:hypothetical protein
MSVIRHIGRDVTGVCLFIVTAGFDTLWSYQRIQTFESNWYKHFKIEDRMCLMCSISVHYMIQKH